MDMTTTMRQQLEKQAIALGLRIITGEGGWDLAERIIEAAGVKNDPMHDDDSDSLWTQRDGTTIPVREMSDKHLGNAISMLLRQGKDGRTWHTVLTDEVERRCKLAPPEILCSQCGEPLRQLEDAYACDPCGRMLGGGIYSF